MDRVEKTVYQVAGSSYMGLVIHGKDCGRIIRFSTPSYADTGRAFESLNTYAFPGKRNLGYLFAFESKRQEIMKSINVEIMYHDFVFKQKACFHDSFCPTVCKIS